MKWYAGVDEVGWGAAAGPLVACCVTLQLESLGHWPIPQVRDSKELSKNQRRRLSDQLLELFNTSPHSFGLGVVSSSEINESGYTEAWDKATRDAVLATREDNVRPDLLIVDGSKGVNGYPRRQLIVDKADSKYFVVAAASILAKVYRDSVMEKLSLTYPEYGWEKNSGYLTDAHMMAIEELGMCPEHRVQPVMTALKNRRRRAS